MRTDMTEVNIAFLQFCERDWKRITEQYVVMKFSIIQNPENLFILCLIRLTKGRGGGLLNMQSLVFMVRGGFGGLEVACWLLV